MNPKTKSYLMQTGRERKNNKEGLIIQIQNGYCSKVK